MGHSPHCGLCGHRPARWITWDGISVCDEHKEDPFAEEQDYPRANLYKLGDGSPAPVNFGGALNYVLNAPSEDALRYLQLLRKRLAES